MGNPWTSPSISNYNSNPPSDDGSTTASNRLQWSTHKTKLADPIKTYADAIVTNTSTAFGKVPGGASGITSTAVDYTIASGDQGKLVRATSSGITITTPDATSVGEPFLVRVLNNSSGTITLAGNNPGTQQDIDGSTSITLGAGQGVIIDTDGTNWFTSGLSAIPAGKQMMYGQIINGTIAESNATNAVTYSLKTLAGNDPSSTDPVVVAFRNATAATGNYVYRTITAATSLTVSSGSTLGAVNSVAFRVDLVLFDDAGTIRIGAINGLDLSEYYAPNKTPTASSTAEGGAGAADSVGVFYTGTAVTSKPFIPFAYADYNSGLATAGSWNVSPTVLGLYSPDALVGRPGFVTRKTVGTDVNVASTTDVSIFSKTVGGVVAGDVIEVTADLLLINGTGAGRTYTFDLTIGSKTLTIAAGGSVGNGQTATARLRVSAHIISSSSFYAIGEVFIADNLLNAGGSGSLSTNSASAAGFVTESADHTGSQLVTLYIKSDNTGTTQTARLLGYSIRRIPSF